jgi:hypothetical protein
VSTASARAANKAALPVCSVVEPLGFTVQELAELKGCSKTSIFDRFRFRTCAYLAIGDGTLRVLRGDHNVLMGEEPSPDTDGRATIAGAFAGRSKLRLDEIAAALRVCTRTIERLAKRGELPVERETGRALVDAAEFRRWLLAHRTPTRWEVRS